MKGETPHRTPMWLHGNSSYCAATLLSANQGKIRIITKLWILGTKQFFNLWRRLHSELTLGMRLSLSVNTSSVMGMSHVADSVTAQFV